MDGQANENLDQREEFVALFVRHEVGNVEHLPRSIAWSERENVLATADGTVKLWEFH